MKKFEYWRMGVLVAICLGSFIISLPTLRLGRLSEAVKEKLHVRPMALGLDLEGGMDLTYKVKPIVRKGQDAVTDPGTLQSLAYRTQEVLTERIDSTGTLLARITVQGSDQIRVQIPSQEAEKQQHTKEIIQAQQFLSFHETYEEGHSKATLDANRAGSRIFEGATSKEGAAPSYYLLKEEPEITGDLLANAEVTRDELNNPRITFTWKAEGADKFGEITARLKGRRLAVVLSNKVYSAPVIEEQIRSQGVIRGSFNEQEARRLVQVLNLGALPAQLEPLAENSVGPSLGKEAQEGGIHAAILGCLLVFAFMLIRYKLSGLFAIITLIANFLMQIVLLVWFDATLTLPGIAGFALTVGMAVDANILIFERMREELRAGKPVRSAIAAGYDKVFFAIVDGHVTSIITGLILYNLGTGPIRGFAVTLMIGLIVNLFTALWMTRVLQDWKYSGRDAATMSV